MHCGRCAAVPSVVVVLLSVQLGRGRWIGAIRVMLRTLFTVVGILLILVVVAAAGGIGVFYHYGRTLPDYRQLAGYQPPVMTRVHAGDGRLIAEYAQEKRVFVPIEAMPRLVIQAFLAAEDKSFYDHPGVNLLSVARAAVTNLRNMGSDRRPVGASTITQQVAKNFLLTNEVSFERKIKEAILAVRIEQALSKDRILELYLNEIYLGTGSYGVAAAALNYFGKSLDELTVSEAAYLAGLPKAPNNYHPGRFPQAAAERRDWVIGRMLEDGLISSGEAAGARSLPVLVAPRRTEAEVAKADYFAEEVRRQIAARYGETALYRGGLSVRTTLDPNLQRIADRTLRAGLEAYDRRHGWRGPLARINPRASIAGSLSALDLPIDLRDRELAAVLAVDGPDARIGLMSGRQGTIPMAEMVWARPAREEQRVGAAPKKPSDVLAPGDVVLVEAVSKAGDGTAYPADTYALRQIPEIEGGLVALDPHTGRILAMSGGYDFKRSQFNRATQASRQPGSAFKPFVYLAALDAGYTPSTLILDAPFVIEQGPGLPKWRPDNYTREFYGPSTMRTGIEKSRNLMTVRLAQTIGMESVADYARRFGVVDRMPPQLSASLGAVETTLLRLTAGYAMLVNGGKEIVPTLIDRIQDRQGRTVFRHDSRPCPGCQDATWIGQGTPQLPDQRRQLTDPASAYQMVSMLQGVVERGTGVRIKEVGKPLAGKTGTTNDSMDAWFIGFAPDLAVGVFIGFDEPRSLGDQETGASAAVPVFRDFMAAALKDKPPVPFRIPPGIRLVRVDSLTGEPVRVADRNVIFEAFKPGSEPSVASGRVLEGFGESASSEALRPQAPETGTGGGLY